MNKVNTLLKKFQNNACSWEDYLKFLELDNNEELEAFFKFAQELKKVHFGDILKIYIPNKRFPPISITGNKCELHCEHCNEKYLNGMHHIINKVELENYLIQHYKNGGIGALISGGCLLDGSVPLLGFLDALKNVKNKTDLILNIHTGLLNNETAKQLANINADIISFDINMDTEIIKEIYHLNKDINDYKEAIRLLKKNNLNIVPHICVGLYYGELHKELNSIKFIKESKINPSLIVLIVLIPPKESKKHFKTPNPYDIAKVITIIRTVFPKSEISLGCMRPRDKIRKRIEKFAIKAGITRIELPLRQTYEWVMKKFSRINIEFYSACCAIPQEYEKKAKMSKSEIKKYQRNGNE